MCFANTCKSQERVGCVVAHSVLELRYPVQADTTSLGHSMGCESHITYKCHSRNNGVVFSNDLQNGSVRNCIASGSDASEATSKVAYIIISDILNIWFGKCIEATPLFFLFSILRREISCAHFLP